MLCDLGLVVSLTAPVANISRRVVNYEETLADAIVFANSPTTEPSESTEVAPVTFHVSPLFDFVNRSFLVQKTPEVSCQFRQDPVHLLRRQVALVAVVHLHHGGHLAGAEALH